jgi:hypothetical protein
MQPVEAVGQVVQLLREQLPIAAQGDRRRLVAQVVLLLKRLDACTFFNRTRPTTSPRALVVQAMS